MFYLYFHSTHLIVHFVYQKVYLSKNLLNLDHNMPLYNPFEKKLDVEVVEVYGTGKSMNFGDVSVDLKLKAKTVTDRIDYIGDDKTTAYDDEGNVYRIDNTAYSIKVAEGISVKADLGSYGLHFLNVPKKTEKLQLVKLFLYNDFEDGNGACRGYIELRDVPIAWRE